MSRFIILITMVKNISNPINSRKIGEIFAEHLNSAGINTEARKISVFLSDHSTDDLITAVNIMKEKDIIPKDYSLSPDLISELISNEFLQENYSHTEQEQEDDRPSGVETRLKDIQSITQYDSLKNKFIKGWTGNTKSFDEAIERFEQKFSRPMQEFNASMNPKEILNLQSYAVVFASDHLGLRESSKEYIFYMTFGRFDNNKKFLKSIGVEYEWPDPMGMNYIQLGRKYSITAELIELAKNLKNVSGLDTYPDEIFQELFYQLLSGNLTKELIAKKAIWRWHDPKLPVTEDPFKYLIPPTEGQIEAKIIKRLTMSSIVQIFLNNFDTDIELTLSEAYAFEAKELEKNRIEYLVEKLEHGLTRKTAEIQFGRTLSNFMENLRTNPGTVSTFIDTARRYLNKAESVKLLVEQSEHNILVGLNNSTGVVKSKLMKLSNAELNEKVTKAINSSLVNSMEYLLMLNPDLADELSVIEFDDPMFKADQLLMKDQESSNEFCRQFFSNIYIEMQSIVKEEEIVSETSKIVSTEISEKTDNFLGRINYLFSNDALQKKLKDEISQNYAISDEIVDLILQGSSYIVYQILGFDGKSGEIAQTSLINELGNMIDKLGNFQLANNSLLKDHENFYDYVVEEITQMHVIAGFTGKLRQNAFNTWTSLPNSLSKSTNLFIEGLLDNLLFWQRMPKSLIESLVDKELITNKQIPEILTILQRRSFILAYKLITMGLGPSIWTLKDAEDYILKIFNSNINNFLLVGVLAHGQLIYELTYLWAKLLNLTKDDQSEVKNAITLALNLSKGFGRELYDRNWLNQVYFSKLSMMQEEGGFQPILYNFSLSDEKEVKIPPNLIMSFYSPKIKRVTQMVGIVVLGGNPEISDVYAKSDVLMPFLEGLLLDPHNLEHDNMKLFASEILALVANKPNLRKINDIYEQNEQTVTEKIPSFYPILKYETADNQLSLPNTFMLDAVFIFEINESFFFTDKIGGGLNSMSLYINENEEKKYDEIAGNLAFSLVLKYQPMFNDILTQLRSQSFEFLPANYQGHLIPKTIILKDQSSSTFISLIGSMSQIGDKLFYNVAIARSDYQNGEPISFLEKALAREKFGSQNWREKLGDRKLSIDSITFNLRSKYVDLQVVDNNGNFDLGRITSLK
jgi:hypothetical protein